MNGVLYVMHHPSFQTYCTEDRPEVYKLGLTTKGVANRRKGYTTSFVGDVTYKYVSESFADVHKAEKIVFYLLKSERLSKHREFFGVSIDRVKNVMENVRRLTPEQFARMYTMICFDVVPSKLRETLSCEEVCKHIDAQDAQSFTNMMEYDEFLETYRFRPSKPEMYPNYTPPEVTLFLKLIKGAKEETQDE